MAQKIVIQVAQEADWPKMLQWKSSKPDGAKFVARTFSPAMLGIAYTTNLQAIGDIERFLLRKDIDENSPLMGFNVFFNSEESALRWWLDPKPIEPPKPLTFADLLVGDHFQWDGKTAVKFSSMEALDISDGRRWVIGNDIHVTRFYGTIEVRKE